MNTHHWSIVILCYNEAATLERVVRATRLVLQVISPSRSQIVLVDDGSTDGSAQIVTQLAAEYDNVQSVRHEVNQGIGPSLRDGYHAATGDLVVAIPADGQFDVRELLPHMQIPAKTILAFFRRENQNYSVFRNGLSLVNKLINRHLLGCPVKDVNWATVYPVAAVRELDLQLTSSLVESEICAKLIARGYQVVECESVYHRRVAGVSKGGSLKTVLQAARDTLRLLRVVWNDRQRMAAY